MSRTEIEIIKDGKIVAADLAPDSVLTAAIGNLQVTTAKLADRSVTAQKLDASINFFPTGGIVMWSGTVLNIPSGWTLCNGQNGTPDLRDRFIVGAGSNYSTGSIGGVDSVSLSESQMPSHSHSISSAGDHSHSGSTGGDGSHSHSGQTGGQSQNHYHGGVTDGNGQHQHGYTLTLPQRGTSGGGARDGANPQGGATDGAGLHQHTFNTYGVSNDHSHGFSVTGGGHSHSVSINSAGNHSHSMSAAGGGAAHENRPPYYALCFIMKT
jgi:microcystin-dependent protein